LLVSGRELVEILGHSYKQLAMLRFSSLVILAVALAKPALTHIDADIPLIDHVEFVKEGNKITVPNAADGIYTSHNGTHLAYYGTLDVDPDVPLTVHQRDLKTRQLACDVSCNGQHADAVNITAADQGMANYLATNPNFRASISYAVGNVWAFGCDYGNGQSESNSQWNFDIGCVNAQCSTSGGGWNSHHQWKSTFGREIGGYSC